MNMRTGDLQFISSLSAGSPSGGRVQSWDLLKGSTQNWCGPTQAAVQSFRFISGSILLINMAIYVNTYLKIWPRH